MKFRKKSVIVEAVQFTVDTDPPKGVVRERQPWGGGESYGNQSFLDEKYGPIYKFFVITPEGNPLEAKVGDWIITGADGEMYPCKPDIFERFYESA